MQPAQLRDETGTDEQQDQGHHDLHDEAYRPSPDAGPHAALDGHHLGHPRHAPRRQQATEHRRHDADASRKHECAPIERQIDLNGEDTGGQRHRAFQQISRPQGENHTAERAANGEDKSLGQQLPE